MSRSRLAAFLAGAAYLLTGCATMTGTRGALDDANWTCLILGGLLGGTAGVVIANPNHGEDEDDQALAGGAIGAVVGAAIGNYLCGARENQLPTAQMSAEPMSGEPPLEVSFRGTGRDPDGEITAYHWEFGDGRTSDEQHATHVYSSPGTYTATLRVTDDDGGTGSASARITVARPAPRSEARRIVLRGINFAFDSARIEPEFEPVLDVAVQELRDNPGVTVEVSGHTDWTGTDEYNQGLSERRARSVVRYLVSKGIDAQRLHPVGYGESRPVADNATRDGRAQNRRVELNAR